jgi:ABC-type transport system involved in multi-copper enzyme maturation permease subunit
MTIGRRGSLTIPFRLVLREIHDQTWSPRFIVLTITAGLLTPVLMYAGIRDFTNRQQQFALLQQQRQNDVQRSGDRLNGRQLEPSLRALRPPLATSVLVRGLEGAVPTSWDFGPDGIHPGPADPSALGTPQSGASLDLEFLIRIVLGLLAVFLAADSLASDRHTGTLSVLLSQPLSKWTIVAAKFVGGITAVGLSLLLVMTGAALAIGVFGPDLWSPEFTHVLVTLTGAAMLYLVALYALGLAVGCLSSSTTAANIWAISVWMVFVLASVPAFEVAVNAFAPLPPAGLVEAQRQNAFEARLRETEIRLGALLQQLVGPQAKWSEVDPPEAVRHQLAAAWASAATATRTEMTAIDDQALTLGTRRRRWLGRLSLTTPAALWFEAATCIAGTGTPTIVRWERAATSYQSYLNQRLFDDPPRLTLRVKTDRALAILPFQVRPLPATTSLKRFVPPGTAVLGWIADAEAPIAALTTWCITLTILACLAFAKLTY